MRKGLNDVRLSISIVSVSDLVLSMSRPLVWGVNQCKAHLLHVRPKHHINDLLPERCHGLGGHAFKEVVGVVLEEAEGRRLRKGGFVCISLNLIFEICTTS